MSGQLDAAIRHHAMESGAFVVNATRSLADDQRTQIVSDPRAWDRLNGSWPAENS